MINIEANSFTYRRLLAILAPVVLIAWLFLMAIFLSEGAASSSENVRFAIIVSVIVGPGFLYAVFGALDMSYVVLIDGKCVNYIKNGIFNKTLRVINFNEITEVETDFFGNIYINLNDKCRYKIIPYLSVDFDSLDLKSREAFDALQIHPGKKPITLIRLVIESKTANPPSEANFREEKAFEILNGSVGRTQD
ncbi:hypothetical protein [Bdellovibrio bacteriovorus]|uniref:hypothetical protein n=1 Tax=Bdellovibrio bacteriovorus TaxID=959 RepID=UPI003D05084C